MNAREAAYVTLQRTFGSRSYSNIELDNAIKKYSLDGVERSFFTALYYGVIEKKLTLDYIISQFSERPIDEIDPNVLIVLEMGVYQLEFMDKIPESAAVNESVNISRRFWQKKNSDSFINAVLRSYLRGRDGIKYPSASTVRGLSVKYSMPEWICRLWQEQYGRDAEALLDRMTCVPKMTLNVNTMRITRDELLARLSDDGIAAEPSRLSSGGIRLRTALSYGELEKYSGLFFVQDEASQLVAQVLSPKPGDTVIDCCACPGGKSFAAAICMNNKGRIYAFDLHGNKLSLITNEAQYLGIDIIETAVQNGTLTRAGMPSADCVICDVPCSGLGVIAKKPDIRYKAYEDIADLPSLQSRILDVNSQYVKNGGALVYSTCTLRRAENAGVVETFLAEHGDFALEPFAVGDVMTDGMTELRPDLHKTDGFFIAKLRRK